MTGRHSPDANNPGSTIRTRARHTTLSQIHLSTVPYDILAQYRLYCAQYDEPTRANETDVFATALREWFVEHAFHIVECGEPDDRGATSGSSEPSVRTADRSLPSIDDPSGASDDDSRGASDDDSPGASNDDSPGASDDSRSSSDDDDDPRPASDDLLWVHYTTEPWSVPVITLHLDIPRRHDWIDLDATIDNVVRIADACHLNVANAPQRLGADEEDGFRTSSYPAAETPANEEVCRITLELASLDHVD